MKEEMCESRFWIYVWVITATVLMALLFTIALVSVASDYQIRMAIKDGATPLEAACALGMNRYDMTICAVELLKDK